MNRGNGGSFADERPEADALEQQRSTAPADERGPGDRELPLAGAADADEQPVVPSVLSELLAEADQADVCEQRRVVPDPDEDDRR